MKSLTSTQLLDLMNQTPVASYIIPFRMQDNSRLKNLKTVVNWIQELHGIEIILVEQDLHANLSTLATQLGIKYGFIFTKHAFNKSLAMNVGAQLATSNILILADADMIVSHQTLSLSIKACQEHVDAVNPYQYLQDLDEIKSNEFILYKTLAEQTQRFSERQVAGEVLCFCGGIYLMKKSKYLELGGMDENFFGWGGEDDAMSIKLTKLGISQLTKKGDTAYHLWHPRDIEHRYHHLHYQDNLALLRRYQTMTSENLLEYLNI